MASDSFELRQIPDGAGKTLTVLSYNGRLYPNFPHEAIKGVATLNARPDDVLVCAYPKSGTHWVWEMVRLLLAGTTDLPMVEKDDGMIEDALPESIEKMESPRNLNTHVHFELLPPAAVNRKSRIVYVTRDPRDVAVSYFHHHRKLKDYYNYDGEFKDHLPMFLKGTVDYESWFDYTKGWERGIKEKGDSLPIHVTSYEALHADTPGELRRLAEYLGVSADDSFIQQVVEKTSFSHMRSTKGGAESFGNGSPVMYRKGKVGDWKNHFTVSQWEQFDAVFEKEMAGTQAYDLYSFKSKSGIYQNGAIV